MAGKSLRQAVLAFAEERFGTKPEYLWSRTPDCAVLRCANDKWYAIIMDVDGRKVGLPEAEKVDIVNVKCSPMMTGSLLAMKGIAPAYHMNKESWISVLLDGSVDIEQVRSLLEMSHELAGRSGSGKRLRTEPKEWIIPAAPAMYDVEQDFRRDGTILWKQTSSFIVGDTVYIYMASPVSAIMYKCVATEVDIPYKYDNGNYHIKKAMKLKLVHRFAEGEMTFARMKEYGVAAVRSARGVPNTLSCELKRLCSDG